MKAGLYIHIPYCHAKCAYCDFYSTPDSSTALALVDCLLTEARLRRDELPCRPSTVYIGGGTPSSLGAEALAGLISGLGNVFDLGGVEEFTVEVNPEDVTAHLLDTLRQTGVNRVSMGVQSLVDRELQAVGRRHTAAQAAEAARLVASRFDNFSLDLIFGLPGQTLDSLRYSLNGLVGLGAPHLSAYLLSYEQGTRLYASLMAGKIEEASEELCEQVYRLVCDTLASAGYEHYEISNYARPGHESRHNSSYWNGTPYLGLGPGAHSFDGTVRRYNPRSIKEYITALSDVVTCCVIEPESPENRFNDFLITRLRTSAGIVLDDSATVGFTKFISQVMPEIERLAAQGALIKDDRHIAIPRERWLTSDAVLRQLIV